MDARRSGPLRDNARYAGRSRSSFFLVVALALAWLPSPCGGTANARELPRARPTLGLAAVDDTGDDKAAANPHPSPARDTLLARSAAEQPSIAFPVVGGILGGALGTAFGTIVGLGFAHNACDDSEFLCVPAGAVVGLLFGEAFFLPIGVHTGNCELGSLSKGMLASFGVLVIGTGILVAADGGEYWFAIPLIQLAACVSVERETAADR